MGPHPYGRGNISSKQFYQGAPRASMGPHPYGRGNLRQSATKGYHCRVLQWGRTLTGAGITVNHFDRTRCTQLQWGRTLTGAGMPPWPRGRTRRSCRFNGAAPLRARESERERGGRMSIWLSFNGAAPLRARECSACADIRLEVTCFAGLEVDMYDFHLSCILIYSV